MTAVRACSIDVRDYGYPSMSYSLVRQVLAVWKRKHKNSSNIRRQREKKTPISTRQWLILTFGISVVVGVIFILSLYYQLDK